MNLSDLSTNRKPVADVKREQRAESGSVKGTSVDRVDFLFAAKRRRSFTDVALDARAAACSRKQIERRTWLPHKIKWNLT